MQKTYDVIGKFKYLIWVPVAVIVVGIFFNIFSGANLSIDFTGGSTLSYSYEGKLNFNELVKETEKAIKDAGSQTTLVYSYTGTLESTNVKTTLDGVKVDGITFTTENGTDSGNAYVYVYAIGNKLLKKDDISKVTKALQSGFADNKIVFKSKTEKPYTETKVEAISSQDLATGDKTVKTNVIGNISLTTAQLDKIKTAVETKFANNKIESTGSTTVSASFGSLFFGKSLYAVMLASIFVIIYVGIRFKNVGGVKAAISALIALIHDITFIYFIDVIFGITIDTNFIAVFLTILGYSLNDTIVIYDRIRENKELYGNKKSIRELTNLSISQSMKRTAVTSLTTFVAIMTVVVVASIKGLDSILTFAIPMSIGTICGTFSSLFVAGPIYVFWCERKEKKGDKDNHYTNKINPKKARKKAY